MSTWNIYHKDGSKLTDVNGEQITVHGLEYSDSWMGECFLTINFKHEVPINFQIGDYIVYRGERFELNYEPGKDKQARPDTYGEGFVYDSVKFNALQDELARAEFLDVVLNDNELHYTALPKFPFYVQTLDDLLDRIQANLDEQIGKGLWKIYSRNMERSVQRGTLKSEWLSVYGEKTDDNVIESMSITVDSQKCWQALALVNEKWDVNFIVRGRNIYVGTTGIEANHIFKYGLGKGLYEIVQNADSDQSVITRLRAYGSEKNLPSHYYADLGVKYVANITKVVTATTYVDLELDIDYIETYFKTKRKYAASGESQEQENGWVLQVTFDFKTVITGYVTQLSGSNKCRFYSELKGTQIDSGDEESKEKLDAFIAQVKAGNTKMYITSGLNKKVVPSSMKEYAENLPNNMSINRLMLPGFPHVSLSDFYDSLTEQEKKYVNPTGKQHIFSTDPHRPYIDSINIEQIGLRSSSQFFDTDDKTNGVIEIYPTIEEMEIGGVRVDEIGEGVAPGDDGRFGDNETVKNVDIYLNKAIDFDINDLKDDDFSISMKDGMCGGRTFKVASSTKVDGRWRLTIERVKDDALELWFPYRDYPIKKGDHFVLTGITLPDSYVNAASLKLLKYAIALLDKNDYTRYVYQPKVDELFMARQHDKAVADSTGTIKSLHDTLKAGDLMNFNDTDLNIEGVISIDQLIIKEEDGNIPTYDITLREDKEVGTIQKIQQQISSLQSGNGGTGAGLTTTQVKNQVASEGSKHFISKINDDTAKGTITWEKVQKLLSGLLVGENFSFDKEGNIIANSISSDRASEENGKGFTILQKDPLTNTYKLCIDEVIAYTVATVGKLFVNGNSRFGGELSSKQFISGFLGGLGWGIYNTPVTNAAGEQENKWTGEFDNVIVRGSLRVFEMIISQLLGESDNRIFTGMMEVDHYDPESGKVYLNTQDGKLYNPFRRDDIIMVQQYNGTPSEENDHYVTKTYELLITDAGCGSQEDGDKRLDWVTFTNFTTSMEGATAESLIKKKDTFVRVDNLSDSQRKGIIQLMTVGANTPCMDIIYGLKTDPDNALKGRLGNLKGIVHPILGELSGFGEFLNNLYAVGDFIIQRTGESVDSKLQVLENMFSSRFTQTSYELTNSDNYLENGQFLEQVRDDDDTIISCWAVDSTDESMFWADALGNPFMVNGLLSVSGNRKVSIDKMDGRQVLRLQNCGVKQLNAHIKQPGTHKEYQQPSGSTGDNGLKKPATGSTDVQDRLYISIRIFAKTAGTLTIGFEGCSSVSGKSNTLTAQNIAVPYSGDWTNIPLEGVWNGTGDFVLRYTGDCYIAIASITDKPLSEFSKSVSTQIKQTATNIQLLGENIDNVNGTTTQLGLDLDAEKKSIRAYVDETDKANRTFTTSGIEASVGKVQAWVKNLDYATNTTVTSNFEILSGRIASTVDKVDANSTSITNIQQDIKTITQTVGQAATKEQLKDNVATLNRNIDSARSHADDVGTGIRNEYASTITLVKQNSSSWSVAAGGFDENGKLKSSAGAVLTTDFAGLFVEQVDAKGLVNTGQMNVAIRNGITTATIQADKINLTGQTMAFTGGQITITTDNFTLDGSGNMWCQNGTFSGTVKGVHGSFKNLDCVDRNGNVVGSIQFGTDGRLTFSGDMNHQGYDNDKKRGWRFYAADIWCRGMFGHRQKTVAIISDTIMRIYTKESAFEDSTFVMKYLEKKTATDGKTYWNVPLYLYAADGDASGMPIDVIVFVCHSDDYYVFTEMGMGKEWRVINGNDKKTVHFADIGGWHELKGGASLSCVYIGPSNLSPKPTSLGAGVFWSGEYDLNWS